MAEQRAKQSNPFSTGGGGVNFEVYVQTYIAMHIVTGDSLPFLSSSKPVKMKLQGHYDGYNTDDCIVFGENGEKALCQIKHSITVSENDSVFRAVISDAWNDYCNSDTFNKKTDRIILIVSGLSKTDTDHTKVLFEWAGNCENEDEFTKKIATEGFSSKEKQKKYGAVKAQIESANGAGVSDYEIWDFFRHFNIQALELDNTKSPLFAAVSNSFSKAVGMRGLENTLYRYIAGYNQNAGTITKEQLLNDLKIAKNMCDRRKYIDGKSLTKVILLLIVVTATLAIIYFHFFTTPVLYKSELASFSEIEHYEYLENISDDSEISENSGEFDNVFAIIGHLKNVAFTGKRVDSTVTTITEISIDESIELGAVGDIYNDTLKIFIINNSWGTAENVSLGVFFQDNGEERPITDVLEMIYDSEPITIGSGSILKGAEFRLNKEKFIDFINGYYERNNNRVLAMYCRMTTAETQCESRIGWIGYDDSRGGFYLSAGGGDETENVYKKYFCKLDVEEALSNCKKSGKCTIRFLGKDAYPFFDRFVTIETGIAPTKSCYITCHNTFEIGRKKLDTEDFSVHVKVPYYREGTIDVFSELTPILSEADAKGFIELKSFADEYVYDADKIISYKKSSGK